MVDPRLDVVARLVGRVEGQACRLAALATRVPPSAPRPAWFCGG